MNFINTITDSLFSPSRLGQYVNDKKIKTFFYFLVLAIIFVIPNILVSFTLGDITYNTKVDIRNELRHDTENLPFVIHNGMLYTDKSNIVYETKIASNISIYIGLEERAPIAENGSNHIYISFLSDGVYVDNSIIGMNLFKYSDYEELEGLDFNGAINDDNEFWDVIFGVSQKYIDNFKLFLRIGYVGYAFFQGIITILIWSLLITLFNRVGGQYNLSFSKHWKLDVYGMTGFVLGSVLASLFSLGILYYIGLILSLIVCNIGTHNNLYRGGNHEL